MTPTEQRLWTRLSPADNEVQLKTKQGIVSARAVDVSFGGLAAISDRQVKVNIGDPMDVCWRGSWMRGVVRYLDQSPEEGFRVGIEWAKK